MRTQENPRKQRDGQPVKRVSRVEALRQIENAIRERVKDGTWPVGTLLPGHRDLAAEFEVNLNTVQRALIPLISDGTLRADAGRGTFVLRGAGTDRARPVSASMVGASEPYTRLRTARACTIGVVVPYYPLEPTASADAHWPVAVVHGLERTVANAPGSRVLAPRHESLAKDASFESQVHELISAQVDAFVIVFMVEDRRYRDRMPCADFDGAPVVFVSGSDIGPAASHVFYDNVYDGYHAARHLVEQGYSDLLFLAPYNAFFVQERLLGAKQFVAGVAPDGVTIADAVADRDAWDLTVTHHELARTDAVPFLSGLAGRGVIAASDYVAIGIMEAASRAGLAAGRDYGIIGFDDRPESRGHGLTTMHPPLDEMGVEAGRMVIRALHGETAPMQVRLCSHLIPRSSTTHTISRKDNINE